MTHHTKGPWLAAARPSSIVGWPVVGQGGRLICDVALGHKPPDISDGEWSAHYVEVDANAHLIAAAPDMHDALAGLLSVIDAAGLLNLSNGVQLGQTSWYVKASDAVDYARGVLAKASISAKVAELKGGAA